MGDRVIELVIDRAEPPRPQPASRRWLLICAIALAVLAATAVIAGRAQRPKPPAPPQPHNYVSSPGFTLYTQDNGDVLFVIGIHSYSGNPITVSMPKVTLVAGAQNLRLMLTSDETAIPTPGSHGSWPATPGEVSISPYGDASLGVSYHVGCASVGQQGPFVNAARVQAVAGSVRSFRNVMPTLNPDVAYGKPYCPSR